MNWMDWLKKLGLKGLIQPKILTQLKNANGARVAVLGKIEGDDRQVIFNGNVLIFNGLQLTAPQINFIISSLPELVDSRTQIVDVIEEEYEQKKAPYEKIIYQRTNNSLIEYFSDKIPQNDLLILKAALVLKDNLNLGKDTWNIKKQILQRHGLRGGTICNLYTGGYFESWIKPTFEEMSTFPGFNLEKFKVVYEEIIGNCPFAIFISSQNTPSEAKRLIESKYKQATTIGIKYIYIHGIGKDNIQKIIHALVDLIGDNKYTTNQVGRSFKATITVE